ncbi:MAG TPA: PIG-L family deacetylase [Anaerolineales bacterium]|nr:PIG-L family deacetylase [Anaerolineales bacterium]
MRFHQENAQIYVPDCTPEEEALARTTHLAIGAHQDDLEIMAAAPILECFRAEDRWFSGVVVTDGRGSPREGIYKEFSDEQMRLVRIKEQQKAASIGEYASVILLDYPSKTVKDRTDQCVEEDLGRILEATGVRTVYTHNLADKHDTHVAVAVRVIHAIRSMPPQARPLKLFGCVVWRDLDWLLDADKVTFDLSSHENLQGSLLGVFDSQICGGKRYDLATMGRRRADATYFESHAVDSSQGLAYAMDLTPLIERPEIEIQTFTQAHIDRFASDVADRLGKLL